MFKYTAKKSEDLEDDDVVEIHLKRGSSEHTPTSPASKKRKVFFHTSHRKHGLYLLQEVQFPKCNKEDEHPEPDKQLQYLLKHGRGQIYSSISKSVANIWINEEWTGWRGKMSPAGHLALHCQWAAFQIGHDFSWDKWYQEIYHDSEFRGDISVDDLVEFAELGGCDPMFIDNISVVCHGNLVEALYSFQYMEQAIEYLEIAHYKEPKVSRYVIGLGEMYESLQ